MSISAMKQAAEALEVFSEHGGNRYTRAADALRQAIAEAEKQEPVAVKHMMDWVYQLKRFSNDGRYMNIPSGLSAGACYELAVEIEQFIKTEPVHAIDMSQERVYETARCEHEPVAWIVDGEIKVRLDMAGKLYYSETNVYAAPPKREWVGLTHEERDEIDQASRSQMEALFAIEAKLKEKNCG